MIYVLLGPSCSGKTTLLKTLKNIGANTIVSYTTRPIRVNEKDGYDYHFITNEQYNELDKQGSMILKNSFTNVYGTIWNYAVHKDSLDPRKTSFIVTEMNGFVELQKTFGKENVCGILLKVSYETLLNRGLERGDNKNELERRLKSDSEDFKDSESRVSFIIDAENDFVLDDVLRISGGNLF